MPTKDEDLIYFGLQIRRFRDSQGISQAKLAAQLSTSRTYLSQIENGDAANLTYRLARRILRALDLLSPVAPVDVPPALACYAECEGLTQLQVDMLARLRIGLRQPETAAQWRFVHEILKATITNLDAVEEP